MSDFLEEYSGLIAERVPTAQDWIENCALTVLSNVCHNVKLPDKLGTVKLNLWSMVIGPSGLAHKTIPLVDYVHPTLVTLNKFQERDFSLPSSFSIEGMTEYVSLRDDKTKKQINNVGTIVCDEFSGTFKGSRKKEYLSDLMEYLSELHDGRIKKRFTRRAKLEYVPFVYVNFISATTPYLYNILDWSFFLQGVGNRILYTVYEPKDAAKFDPVDFFSEKLDIERLRKIGVFAKRLSLIPSSNLEYIFPDEEAARMWLDYRIEKESEALKRYYADKVDIEYSYIHRMPEKVLKVAGLFRVSRSWTQIPKMRKPLRTLMITKTDMERAIAKGERHLEHYQTLLKEWAQFGRVVKKPVLSEFYKLEMVYGIVADLGGKASRSQIYRKSKLLASDLENVLSTLESQGKLRKEIVATRTKKKIVYKLVRGK